VIVDAHLWDLFDQGWITDPPTRRHLSCPQIAERCLDSPLLAIASHVLGG